MFEIVKDLPFDLDKTVYKDQTTELYLRRPSKLSKRFENYDVKKNFQVWLMEGKRNFRPNHFRVFLDLNLRIRSRPDLKRPMLSAFDAIFYGGDPEQELEDLTKEDFEHFLNPLFVIGVLAQLFLIDQEYSYPGESKFDPPTLFFQGWIRQFIDSPKEIDNLVMSVGRRQSPLVRYVRYENKKDKRYKEDPPKLWYLD